MRKQAVITLVYIPAEPDDTRDCGAAEEADDAGVVPGILVAAVLKGEEELQDSGSEKNEADEVEILVQLGEDH
jgi:hypothetical protein